MRFFTDNTKTYNRYDMAYSLNGQMTIRAESYEEAEAKLAKTLRNQGINLKQLQLEVFDVVEEED